MAYDIDPVRGVVRHYNTRAVDESRGGVEQQDGRVKTIEYVITPDFLPTYAEDGGLTISIPAGAAIVDVYLDVEEDFTTDGGSATLDVGLYQEDGTVIDADGLIAAAAEGDLVEGARITGDGALVGARIGSEAGQVTVEPSEDLTGGEARLLVRYTPSKG